MLRPSGYKTYAVGKWHLSGAEVQNAGGPFDDWPTGRGFDHWYGFNGAASDHWHPELVRNRSAVYPDKSDGYHLTEDLIDQSLSYIKDHLVSTPADPYFLYLAFGACHFPYHVPQNYMEMHRGRYAAGWDTFRAQRLARQKKLAIAPSGATLSLRDSNVPAWNSLASGVKQFSARTQEAYAGFLHHTDNQLQRLVDFLEISGELDNTIIVVLSDNGAGSWAPPAGRLDVHRAVYIEPEPQDELVAAIDKVGTAESQPSYSPGWAQVSNTPLKLYKGDTFEGGIRAPMIIHWPAGRLPEGAILDQYHHVTDIVPTLLQLTNQSGPKLDGKSFAYALDNPSAPTQKKLQYFETAGDRAIWSDGWKAVTNHQKGDKFTEDKWQLYHSDRDFSEATDLSAEHPERLSSLILAWQAEAERNQVLPMADDVLSLEADHATAPRSRYVFYPSTTRITARTAPDIFKYDYEIQVDMDVDGTDASGVLLASGDSMAGYELLMREGHLEFIYIYTRNQVHRLRSEKAVSFGRHLLSLRGYKTGKKSGRVKMLVDGEPSGEMTIPKMWEIKSLNAGVRCGANRGAPVSHTYSGSFGFNQKLLRIVFELIV